MVDRPKNKNIINARWLFKKKLNPDGTVNKYKARLVARGFKQIENQDYENTYSPVAGLDTIRLLIALSAHFNLSIHHLDVSNAFLQSKIDKETYIEIPQCMEAQPNKVLKLQKSLYGLKQAPLLWCNTLTNLLIKNNFKHYEKEPCFLYKKGSDNSICFVVFYVDDILIATDNNALRQETINLLSSKLQLKNLGPVSYFLGLQIDKIENGYFIHQSAYSEKIVRNLNLETCKDVTLPSQVNLKLDESKPEDQLVDKTVYQSLIGALNYISNATRPDITFCVNKAARFATNPSVKHLAFAKQIVKYIKSTINHGLIYRSTNTNFNNSINLVAYSDSDFASHIPDRKSTSGACILLNNNLIHWYSKKQAKVALSTMESELESLVFATKITLGYIAFLKGIGLNLIQPTPIFTDNNSVTFLVKNAKSDIRTRYIEVKYAFIKDKVADKIIKVQKCHTNENVSDMLTKSVPKFKFYPFKESIGNISLQK